MNKIILGLVAFVVIAGASYASLNTKEDGMMDKETSESSVVEDKEQMVGEDTTMIKSGSYEVYAPEKLARAETGDVVLFFHASWCPTCRALNSDIEKNLETIPSDVSILKLDYDTETELKKKYGVTYQHTLVQVDAGGALIKKWSGSPTLSSLVSEIQ